MSKMNDLTGKRFGRLNIVSYKGNDKYGRATWTCKCDCGSTKIILGSSLTHGYTTSCGCYNREILRNKQLKHDKSNTKLYKVWQAMKTRCYNENFIYYSNYGGRGIKMCDEWKNNFAAFCSWSIANGYEDGLTIDRINVDGNYEPSNCRWITRTQQNNNMRKNIFIEYNGKKQTITEWATELNLNRTALYYRIKRGWDAEKALTTPINK